MRQLIDRRLAIITGCCLLVTAGLATAQAEDFFGYCEVVSGPKSANDLDAPPAYVASRPAYVASRLRTSSPSPSAVPQIAAPRSAARQVVYVAAGNEPQITSQARQAIGYYGGGAALATLSQMPRRPTVLSGGSPSAPRAGKPFQTITRDPTVSPYLNLYRDETNSEAAPNYFSFVRPQLDQIETNRRQMRELQQISRKMQNTSPAMGGPATQPMGASPSGRVAHFMDTGQYYGQWQR